MKARDVAAGFAGSFLLLSGLFAFGYGHWVLSWPKFQGTPPEVVSSVVALAEITSDDLVADLGCGDGRNVIEAVKVSGARGLCVEFDALMVNEARWRAAQAGVADQITFIHGDARVADLSGVTVAFLYLSERLNADLAPRFKAQSPASLRLFSITHRIPEWVPDAVFSVPLNSGGERKVFKHSLSPTTKE